MLKIVGILAMLGVLVGAAFGFATTLELNESNTRIEAGEAALAGDADGVQLYWKTFTSVDEFRVAGVEVRDIEPATGVCLVALFSTPGSQIGFFRGAVGANGVAYCYEIYDGGWVDGVCGAAPRAADVNYVSVLIKNGWVAYDGP